MTTLVLKSVEYCMHNRLYIESIVCMCYRSLHVLAHSVWAVWCDVTQLDEGAGGGEYRGGGEALCLLRTARRCLRGQLKLGGREGRSERSDNILLLHNGSLHNHSSSQEGAMKLKFAPFCSY